MSVAVDQTWRETYLQACIDDEVPPRQEVMQIKPSKQNVDDDGHLGPDSRPLVSGSIQLNGNSDERFTSRVHDREALSLCKVDQCHLGILPRPLSSVPKESLLPTAQPTPPLFDN